MAFGLFNKSSVISRNAKIPELLLLCPSNDSLFPESINVKLSVFLNNEAYFSVLSGIITSFTLSSLMDDSHSGTKTSAANKNGVSMVTHKNDFLFTLRKYSLFTIMPVFFIISNS
jgi:hypothetical protein